MDKSQTPPPGAPVIELTEVVDSEQPAAPPQTKPGQDKDLAELDRILAELSAQSPPPAQEDDLARLMAEMGLPPQAKEPEAGPEEGELQELLQELGGADQAGQGPDQGTGDPELDDLLAQLGRQGRPPAQPAAEAAEDEQPAVDEQPEEEAPSLAEPEELVDLVRMTVRRIMEVEAPELVSRLVAQELAERLADLVGQEVQKQLKARVAQEVKDLLRKAMNKVGPGAGHHDDRVVVD